VLSANTTRRPGAKYPPLLPGPVLIERAFNVVRKMPQGGTRKDIFEALAKAGEVPPGDERFAKTHVGSALTILSDSGRLIARGQLKRPAAYHYIAIEKIDSQTR
jgi:hypothetical protein